MIKIISKDNAKKAGLSHYFTGLPCRNGHISKRRISGHCLKCCAGCVSRHNRKNAEKKAAYQKSLSRDTLNRYQRKYKNKHPEKVKRIKRDYYLSWKEKNPHTCYKKIKEWRKANPEKHKAQYSKRRTRKASSKENFTHENITALMASQRKKCAYCKFSIKNKYHIDHIIPLCLGGDNSSRNIQLCCAKCNLSKGGKSPTVYAKEIGLLL